jgi:rhodanese-related sulfurtransferase
MTNRSVLQLHLLTALRQVVLILILSIALGLSVNMIRSGGIPVIGDWSTKSRLTTDDGTSLVPITEAKKLFDKKKAVFLDARDKDSFNQGHIKGAKNLPWHTIDDYFMDFAEGMANDAVIIAYCDGETCNLSHNLAIFLKNMGFSNVRVLVNGWSIWQEMRLPVEGILVEN